MHSTRRTIDRKTARLLGINNVVNNGTTKLIIIDRKAWEQHYSSFIDFIYHTERLTGYPPKTEEWLDDGAVCRRLGISKRTLQHYQDTGETPFSMIGHKYYYKESNIIGILNAKKG